VRLNSWSRLVSRSLVRILRTCQDELRIRIAPTVNHERMATRTGRARARHIRTAMLEQLAEVDARSLSPETARTYLQLGFRPSDQ
jgi:hypothetical protein